MEFMSMVDMPLTKIMVGNQGFFFFFCVAIMVKKIQVSHLEWAVLGKKNVRNFLFLMSVHCGLAIDKMYC